jgi:hypothetical protein
MSDVYNALEAFSVNDYLLFLGAVVFVVILNFVLRSLSKKNAASSQLLMGLPFGLGMLLLFVSLFLVYNMAPLLGIILFIVGAGLIIVGIPLGKGASAVGGLVIPVMVFSFAIMAYFFMIMPYSHNKILLEGDPATAVVMDIGTTGVLINEQPQVRLLLEVYPEKGASYQTEIRMVISPVYLPQFQPGAKLNIKVDPKNKDRVAVESVIRERR